ncbi:MAG TPA: 50S ribosomal protein L4 [Planctomycetota bacterium]|nr:50S ribosomal protein L4 [Planctomycetota bacterium]
MLSLPVYNIMGAQVGTFDVDENVLGGKIRRRLMHDAIVMYEANQRQGTVKTKTRSEVNGTTRKPFKQKGTGNARAGSKKSPIWRGGGVAFGPQPRDYHYEMPKKARKAALKSALLSKFIDQETIVLDQLELESPKTKQVADILRNLKVAGSCLLAIERHNAAVWKSARNIAKLQTKVAGDLSAYDVLKRRRLIITKAAIEGLISSLKTEKAEVQTNA